MRTFICHGAFDKAVAVVEKMCTLEVDDRQHSEIAELVEALGVRQIFDTRRKKFHLPEKMRKDFFLSEAIKF